MKSKGLCIFIVSTYVDGGPPDEAVWFYDWLKDTYADFRVHKYFLQGLDYAIYGLGDSAFDDNYNKVRLRSCRHIVTNCSWCKSSYF